jgi:hypothetical protein
MKPFKTLLHILLALGSMVGFLFGWATLAHAGKPVQPGQGQSSQQALAPLPALPPIQSTIGSDSTSNNPLQFLVPRVQTRSNFPSNGFVTRGS